MRILMFFGIMIGISTLLYVSQAGISSDKGQVNLVAINYAIYRNAAFLYAHNNKNAVGFIDQTSLDLPSNYKALRPWKTRMENSCCYVYGTANAEEIEKVRNILKSSFAVGRASNGQILPQVANSVPVPNFIPEDNLVSVIEVK